MFGVVVLVTLVVGAIFLFRWLNPSMTRDALLRRMESSLAKHEQFAVAGKWEHAGEEAAFCESVMRQYVARGGSQIEAMAYLSQSVQVRSIRDEEFRYWLEGEKSRNFGIYMDGHRRITHVLRNIR